MGPHILNSGNCWYLENSASHSACDWGGFISLTRCQSTMESPDSVSLIETKHMSLPSALTMQGLLYTQTHHWITLTLWHHPRQQLRPPAHCSLVASDLLCGLWQHWGQRMPSGRKRTPPLLWWYYDFSSQAIVVAADSAVVLEKGGNNKIFEYVEKVVPLLHSWLKKIHCFTVWTILSFRQCPRVHKEGDVMFGSEANEEKLTFTAQSPDDNRSLSCIRMMKLFTVRWYIADVTAAASGDIRLHVLSNLNITLHWTLRQSEAKHNRLMSSLCDDVRH